MNSLVDLTKAKVLFHHQFKEFKQFNEEFLDVIEQKDCISIQICIKLIMLKFSIRQENQEKHQ